MKQINLPTFIFFVRVDSFVAEGVRDPSDDRVMDLSPTSLFAITG
jgi:hypothetical protein